jgi:hypothetical protein
LKANDGKTDIQASQAAIAGLPDGSSQVVVIGGDHNLYHVVRRASGSWEAWGTVKGANGADTFAAGDIAIAGLTSGDTQLLAIGNDGNIYHNIRYANTNWQGWNHVQGAGGADYFAATAIAISAIP